MLLDISKRSSFFCIDRLSEVGWREARKYSGFHDEPLKGRRLGQRSVRLSKAYRAIYLETSCGQYQIIEVVEVNKHDY